MNARVALVTGASRGIGKRLSADLAAAGFDLVLTARSSSASPGRLPGTLEETAEQVRAQGRRALTVTLDLRDESGIEKLVQETYAQLGRCDLLVNNAALAPPRPALEDRIQRWRMAFDVNVHGPFCLIWHLAPRMAEAGGGRIVNISSGASQAPTFGRASYTASKAALEAMSAALAHDLRPRKVAVNALRLEVPVWTEGFAATLPPDVELPFEDAAILSDAILWMAEQPLDFSGQVLTIAQLRQRGVVRPFCPADRSRSG